MLFGFKDNKCKQEVYSKDEVDSKYFLKDNIAVIYGEIKTPESGSATQYGTIFMTYPEGFNCDNSVVISLMSDNLIGASEGFATVGSVGVDSEDTYMNYGLQLQLRKNDICVRVYKTKTEIGSMTAKIRLVLMKLPDPDISGYQLGDVNMDGAITEDDLTLMNQYLENTASLTDKQIKLADVNKDGVINSGDLLKMQKYLMGEIDSF